MQAPIRVLVADDQRPLRDALDDPQQLGLLDDLADTIQLSIDRLRHPLFDLRPPAAGTPHIPPTR